MKPIRLLAAGICLVCFLLGCGANEKPGDGPVELLVFCGITMIDPIMELAARFEESHPVKVKLTYGGSQDLARSIEVNALGDIYFPGTKRFVDEMTAKGHISASQQVGHNRITFFVQKGNPKGITGSLDHLKDPDLSVAIGHKDYGSVGREAHRILTGKGIYDAVVRNAAFMASDSKGMTSALREKRVDLVMNWCSVYYFKDNAQFMDEVPLDPGTATRHPLVMATLVYSRNPEKAKTFMALCASEPGRAVFQKYGF